MPPSHAVFAARVGLSSQAQLAESQDVFDPAENGLDDAFAFSVDLAAVGREQFSFHVLCGGGVLG
jgi:hypothetical protein